MPKELSGPLFAPENARATDPVWASWQDGSSHAIKALTVQQWKDLPERERKQARQNAFWEGTLLRTSIGH